MTDKNKKGCKFLSASTKNKRRTDALYYNGDITTKGFIFVMCTYHRQLKNGNIQEFVFELDRNKFELISPIDVNFRFTVYEKFIVFDINTLNKSNQGYGTALISIVLEYTKENKFDFVAGHLARADFENGNWKKSIDFYLHRLSTAFLIKSDLFMRDLYPQYENTQDFFDSQTHYYSYDNFIKEFSEGYIIYPMA